MKLTISERNRIISRNLGLIRKEAAQLYPKYKRHFALAELWSFGVDGILKAIEAHDPSKSRFSTYASIKIRGAILDGIRRPFRMAQYHEKRRDAVERIVQQYLCDHDRPPTEEELAEEQRKRGITRARVKGPPTVVQFPRQRHRDKRCVSFLLFPDRKAPRPGTEIEASETARSLLQGLSARDQQIMHMHYWGGLTTREIAEKLGVKRSSIENRVRLSLAFLRDTLKPRGERVA